MPNQLIDTANTVRTEDRLNKHKLAVYLSTHLVGFKVSDSLNIQQFSGGASNLTYLIQNNAQQAILRTAPRGANIKTAHDMVREYKILQALEGHFSYSPKTLKLCEDNEIIGRPFYLMQKITGIIPRKSFPMPVDSALAKQLCKNLIDVHIALHNIDIDTTELKHLGKGEGYIRRQISGWNQRYKNAMLSDSLAASQLMLWLEDNQPVDTETCLIHNDYKFDNVVLSSAAPHAIIAVLDWEMATIGCPLMDLGCSLAYWIEKNGPAPMQALRMLPTHIDGMFTRQQIIDYYAEKRNINTAEFNYFYVFGLFRLAVIVQQIYHRYSSGKTTNPAFKNFGELSKILIMRAENTINNT